MDIDVTIDNCMSIPVLDHYEKHYLQATVPDRSLRLELQRYNFYRFKEKEIRYER